MDTSGCSVSPILAPGTVPTEGGWQDQALAGLHCAMDFKFRNCSDLYFEKNPWGIKYLQKISSCVNNREIQYSASGPVFNKFENFMILLLLFIAYFICQCLFSQAACIWMFDQLVPTERPNFPCRDPLALPWRRCCPLRPGPLAALMGRAQERVSGRGFLCRALPRQRCPSRHGPAAAGCGGTGRSWQCQGRSGSPVGVEGCGG